MFAPLGRRITFGLKYARIEFEYEPKRFDLGKGRGTYLPDIGLDGQNIFVEITGWDKPGKEEKRALFCEVYGWPYTSNVERRKPTPETLTDFVSMCKAVIVDASANPRTY